MTEEIPGLREWQERRRLALAAIANACEEWAQFVEGDDEACATSMEFVALRLRRVLDRPEKGPGIGPL